jgi:type II secretory pathway predicted ATPase ExeA
MYQQFFGFESTPFSKTIATLDVLDTPSVKELIARLGLVVKERGIGLVTGEIGSGKSTAVRAFLATLDLNKHVIFQLAAPLASPGALYRTLLLALNQHPPFGATAQIAALRTALADLVQTRKTPVIVIDEAHLLPPALIDPLRTLLAADLDSRSLAALILIGQPDLKRMLQWSTLQAFAQRITTRAHLESLSLEATLAYIRHHLKVAGFKHESLFADDALQRIAEYTQGIPRRINQLGTAALIAAAADKKKIVDDTAVRKAINDIEQD